LKRNADEGRSCETTFIEPYPAPLARSQPSPANSFKLKIEQVPTSSAFQQLGSWRRVVHRTPSHIIKVPERRRTYESIRVLPLLKPGVLVHIHDIFTPYDYPEEWF